MRVQLAACAVILLAPAVLARDERPARGGRAPKPAAPVAACKGPAPKDADLAAGLALYAMSDWSSAAMKLGAWAAMPGSDADPAAARGLYALAYAARTARWGDSGAAAMTRARAILEARPEAERTLEDWYYLQGLRQMAGDQAGQLTAVTTALRAAEAGALCAQRDGDDWFRLARFYGFAENLAKRSEALAAAAAAYDAAPAGAPAQYRGLAERDLGEAALTSNDLESAERHLALAAKLDPSMQGVHRQLGLVYLRRGKLEEAAEHWRLNWKREGEGGNMILYALPVIRRVIDYRARPAIQRMAGLSAYTKAALEQDAVAEAKTMLGLRQEAEKAKLAEQPFPPEKQKELETADYRLNELLLEYVTRGHDIQEFALQNGLLPAIHGHDLRVR